MNETTTTVNLLASNSPNSLPPKNLDPFSMAANPWLVLGEYIVALGFQVFSLYVFTYIVIKRLSNNGSSTVIKSPCIDFYFHIQIATAVVNITFIVFYLLNWSPNPTENNSYFLFFIGGTQLLFIILSPISVFGLGLDRILSVLYPVKYKNPENSYPRYFVILLMLGAAVFGLTVILIPTWPTKSTTTCAVFGCMVAKPIVDTYLLSRGISGIFILLNCMILLAAMKYTHNYTQANYKFNMLVFYTLLATLFLDIGSNLGGTLLNTFGIINLQAVIGPYSTVSSCIEMGICAFFYKKEFKKRLNTSKLFASYFV